MASVRAVAIVQPQHGISKARLYCGTTVPFVYQCAAKMTRFSTRYIPWDDPNLVRLPNELPYDSEYNRVFRFRTTVQGGRYNPRTHGRWWDEAPSGPKLDYQPRNRDIRVGHDFIDFLFDLEVCPLRVCIFEAYHPGCVIGIWAQDFDTMEWHKVWDGDVQPCDAVEHRIFFPRLRTCTFKTQLLRLELSHRHVNYYTQIQGVFLLGTTKIIVPRKKIWNPILDTSEHIMELPADYYAFQENDRLCNQALDNELFRLKLALRRYWVLHRNESDMARTLTGLMDLGKKLLSPKKSGRYKHRDVMKRPTSTSDPPNVFDDVPEATIARIFTYLSLRDVLRCSRVSRKFHFAARNPILYTSLNLKPYWHGVNAGTFRWLMRCCTMLRRLDLSWSGIYEIDNKELMRLVIEPVDLSPFFAACGKNLTHLRLDCCQYVNDETMEEIASCDNLRELSLNNCRKITDTGFEHLAHLRLLERLELYRTRIKTESLCAILESNPNLRHINLAETKDLIIDPALDVLSYRCPAIESIDLWYSKSLTIDGLRWLTRCVRLREIDLGFCQGLYYFADHDETLRWFLTCCNRLEKIVLTAQPFLRSFDIETLVHNKHLEQLHLAGVDKLQRRFFHERLHEFPVLQLLDLNCYYSESTSTMERMRNRFPLLCIKWRICNIKYSRRLFNGDQPFCFRNFRRYIGI